MKKITFLIGLIVITLSSFAQVGINTTAPDSSAVLDLNANNKGLLIPTMTTTQREAMQVAPPASGLADGLLVYDTNYKRFYFWDTNISKWVVLNNWRKEYTSDISDDEHVTIVLENSSNVGIGQSSPNSRLTVNGNLSIGNTNTQAPPNGAYVDGQVIIGSGAGTTSKLEIEGTATATDSITAPNFWGRGTVPVGFIGMYSGSTNATLFEASGKGKDGSKMEGWAICNGNNNTPDLRGKFIVGATKEEPINDGDNTYAVKEMGGENTHQLNVNEMPSHNHTGTTDTTGSHSHKAYIDSGGGGSYGSHGEYMWTDGDGSSAMASNHPNANGFLPTNSAGSHHHTLNVDYTGGDQAHENRPPYYAVYYIMRIY